VARVNRSVLWIDAGGLSTITLLLANPTAASIQGAIKDKSNADYLEYWEGPLTINSSPAPTSAAYVSVTQSAVLSFLCADNTIAKIAIPAPQLGIFLSDGQTVDASQVTVLVASCIATLVSNSGSPAVSFLGGVLTGRR